MEILTDIPVEFGLDALLQRIHVDADSEDAQAFESLLDQARAVARPKAIYGMCFVDARGADTVTVAGATFTSRVLRANLDQVQRVFPYVVTCGAELDRIPLEPGDMLAAYWLDAIKTAALTCGIRYLHDHMIRRHALGHTSVMSPGSGDADLWPIEQQKILFQVLGDVRQAIGVELTDSCLMMPNKTVSGIRFPTEVDFRSCRLCHRERCPSRVAAYDPQLRATMSQAVSARG